MNKIFSSLAVMAGKVKFKAIAKAPELWFTGGCIALIGAVVASGKSRMQFEEILEEHNARLDNQEQYANEHTAAEYPPEKSKAERRGVYIQTAKKTVVAYLPTIVLTSLSAIAFGRSFGIMKGRYFSVAAALGEAIRENTALKRAIKDELGEEAYKKITEGSVEETVAGDTGEEEKIYVQPNFRERYSKCFDESNPFWTKSAARNRDFLFSKQNQLNWKLRTYGFVLLNDAYEILGFQKTKAGQSLGWVHYDTDEEAAAYGGQNFIDLGLGDDDAGARALANGLEPSFWVKFNVDALPAIDRCGWEVA